MKPTTQTQLNNHRRSLLRGVAFFLMCTLAAQVAVPDGSFASEMQPPIGTVAKKRFDVYATPPGAPRTRVYPRYDVAYRARIETSGGGAALIRLADQTELYLGERADLVIDEFVFDPDNQQGEALYSLTVGTLRFVSGAMNASGVTLQTPNAYIGIRGSEAIIFVTPDGDTIVNVTRGTFTVRSRERADIPAVTLQAGENVALSGVATFSGIGQGVQLPEYTEGSNSSGTLVPDYSDDYADLKDGGGLDTAREGTDAGARGGSGHDDPGGHNDAPD